MDDNATNCAVVANTLQSWAMVAESAASGDEALAAMRQHAAENRPYQVAIVMPRCPRWTVPRLLVHQIRSGAFENATLLMSPVGESAASVARRRKDFDGWLTKPVRPSHLYKSLRALLELGIPDAGPLCSEPARPRFNCRASANDASHDPVRILVVDDNLVNLKWPKSNSRGWDIASIWLMAARPRLTRCRARTTRSCCSTARCPRWTVRHRRGNPAARKRPRHTIIVAMTAHALEGARLRCLDAGMDEYVAKPVTLKP